MVPFELLHEEWNVADTDKPFLRQDFPFAPPSLTYLPCETGGSFPGAIFWRTNPFWHFAFFLLVFPSGLLFFPLLSRECWSDAIWWPPRIALQRRFLGLGSLLAPFLQLLFSAADGSLNPYSVKSRISRLSLGTRPPFLTLLSMLIFFKKFFPPYVVRVRHPFVMMTDVFFLACIVNLLCPVPFPDP